MAKKKGHEVLWIIISFVATLILHLIFLSRVDMHPTLHVAIGIIVLFAIIGVLAYIYGEK